MRKFSCTVFCDACELMSQHQRMLQVQAHQTVLAGTDLVRIERLQPGRGLGGARVDQIGAAGAQRRRGVRQAAQAAVDRPRRKRLQTTNTDRSSHFTLPLSPVRWPSTRGRSFA